MSQTTLNEHRRIFRHFRDNGNSELSEGERPESTIPTWYERLFKWEALTVAGRTINKGWVLPQPLGIALILTIISGVGAIYWRTTDRIDKQSEVFTEVFSKEMREQRDLMIRLDQRLIDKTVHDAEEQRKVKEATELQAMHLQDVKDKLLVINTKLGLGK